FEELLPQDLGVRHGAVLQRTVDEVAGSVHRRSVLVGAGAVRQVRLVAELLVLHGPLEQHGVHHSGIASGWHSSAVGHGFLLLGDSGSAGRRRSSVGASSSPRPAFSYSRRRTWCTVSRSAPNSRCRSARRAYTASAAHSPAASTATAPTAHSNPTSSGFIPCA